MYLLGQPVYTACAAGCVLGVGSRCGGRAYSASCRAMRVSGSAAVCLRWWISAYLSAAGDTYRMGVDGARDCTQVVKMAPRLWGGTRRILEMVETNGGLSYAYLACVHAHEVSASIGIGEHFMAHADCGIECWLWRRAGAPCKLGQRAFWRCRGRPW